MITLFNIRPRALNVGNDVIAIGMRNLLSEAFGEVVNIISLPATSKYEAHGKAGLDAATIYEINQYGHGVIVGGGNLYENGELELDLNALDALEAPLMLFSLSMGRIYGRLNRLVRRTNAMPDDRIKQLNDKALVSFARCNATLAHLQKTGVEHVQLGGCPTLFLDETTNWLPPVPQSSRNQVLLSIRHPNLMSIPMNIRANVRADILQIVKLLEHRGFGKPLLLCHDYRDIEFATSFKGLEYSYIDDAATFLSILRAARLNITYRLHSALPCLSYGVPVVNLTYDERALSLMETVGYGDWNIDMVKSSDLLADIDNRLGRLDDLTKIKDETSVTWSRLRDINIKGFKDFAKDVRAYSDRGAAG